MGTCAEGGHETGGSDVGDTGTADQQGSEESAPTCRGVLDDERRRASHLTADEEALEHPEEEQQDRCGNANCGSRGNETDSGRGNSHSDDGDHQSRLAAHAVADVAEDEPANRAEQKSEGKAREGRERSDNRIAIGEENRGKDGGRCEAVKVVVEVLHERADGAARNDAALLPRNSRSPRRLLFLLCPYHKSLLTLGPDFGAALIPAALPARKSDR